MPCVSILKGLHWKPQGNILRVVKMLHIFTVVLIVHLYIFFKIHWIVHYRCVHFTICKWYHTEVEEKNWLVQKRFLGFSPKISLAFRENKPNIQLNICFFFYHVTWKKSGITLLGFCVYWLTHHDVLNNWELSSKACEFMY